MNKKENRLKLRENEVVHCETFMLAAQVCELADGLGCKAFGGFRMLKTIQWENHLNQTCYNLNVNKNNDVLYYQSTGKTIITAVEWLNRHDIFVYGQEVYVEGGDTRIYIAPQTCVNAGYEERFKDSKHFQVRHWDDITSPSPFPAWPPEPVKRRLKLDIEVSQEQYDAIKASLGEGA